MNITKECVECIVGQIEKATKLLNLDESLANEINNKVREKSLNFDFKKSPPHVAKDVYEFLAIKSKLKDPLEN